MLEDKKRRLAVSLPANMIKKLINISFELQVSKSELVYMALNDYFLKLSKQEGVNIEYFLKEDELDKK